MCAFERSEKGTDFKMIKSINVKEKMNYINFGKIAETLAAVHTHTHTHGVLSFRK